MPKSNLVKVPVAQPVDPTIPGGPVEAENEVIEQEYEVFKDEQEKDLNDLSIADLEELLEKKRKELGKGVKAAPGQLLPPGKAPSGFIWVYNRGPEKFEWQHNSVIYDIEGHSFGLFPELIAEHGRRRSLLTLDPLTNRTTHQLALPGDKMYGRPLMKINRIEVIDRSTSADPAQLGRGEKTHVAVLAVDGVEQMLAGRVSTEFAELE